MGPRAPISLSLAILATLGMVSSCRIYGATLPCRIDDHCPMQERCKSDGICGADDADDADDAGESGDAGDTADADGSG